MMEEEPTGHTQLRDRRGHIRYPVELEVDYASGDTFLFSYVTNISEMGIFIRSEHPPAVGTALRLRFGSSDVELCGEVVWVNPLRLYGDNPNPGMGIQFTNLTVELREKVVDLVRTVAYLYRDTGAKTRNDAAVS